MFRVVVVIKKQEEEGEEQRRRMNTYTIHYPNVNFLRFQGVTKDEIQRQDTVVIH